jgi:Flp pilus assembly protein TadD
VCLCLAVLAGCATEVKTENPSPFEEMNDRPPSAQTHFALARLLSGQGKDAEALYTLEALRKIHPEYMPTYNELAEIHLRNHRPEEAMAALSAGLEVQPADAVLLNNYGMCALTVGDPATALPYFEKACRASRDEYRYLANQAVALGLLGRFAEARNVYLKMLPPVEADRNVQILQSARGKLPLEKRQH